MNGQRPFSPHLRTFIAGVLSVFEFVFQIWIHLVEQEQLPPARRTPVPTDVLDILPSHSQLSDGLSIIEVRARQVLRVAAFQTSARNFALGASVPPATLPLLSSLPKAPGARLALYSGLVGR